MDTHPTNRTRQPYRPLEHLEEVGSLYPKVWKYINRFRASKGKGGLPDWPDWCFLPMAAFYAIVSKEVDVDHLPPHLLPDVARLAAVGTWRYTQGIYRFDPDVCDAVISTRISGEVPCEELYRLPEWCVYVETPDREWGGMPLHGFFAHMEWDTEKGRATLRLLIDCEAGLFPFQVRLDAATLDGAVSQATDAASAQATGGGRFSVNLQKRASADLAGSLEPLVSLLLYLCGEDADIGGQGGETPGKRMPKPAKADGWLLHGKAARDCAPENAHSQDAFARTGVTLRHASELTGDADE